MRIERNKNSSSILLILPCGRESFSAFVIYDPKKTNLVHLSPYHLKLELLMQILAPHDEKNIKIYNKKDIYLFD